MLVLEESGKPKYPEKNLSEQGRELTTNSTHIWRRRRDLNPGHIGGRRVLSPLRHPCFPKHKDKDGAMLSTSVLRAISTQFKLEPQCLMYEGVNLQLYVLLCFAELVLLLLIKATSPLSPQLISA